MNKLLIVAPNTSIYQSAAEIVREASLNAKVILGSSEDVVERVHEEFEHDAGVVVARGHQAQLIKANTSVPVVDITLSAMDMIILLHQAKMMLDIPHPRIALIGFRYMFPDCTPLEQILDVDPYVYYANTGRDVPDIVDQAISEGSVMVIGGDMACRQAARRGIRSLFMDSMKESVRTAIRMAVHTLNATLMEQQRTAELSTLLDYSFTASLKLDAQGRIENGNYLAERILRHPIGEMRGHRFFEMPSVQITPILNSAIEKHQSLYSTIIRIGNDSFVSNVASLEVEGQHDGFIISMQEFGMIHELEETIRTGRRQQGYTAQSSFEQFQLKSPAAQAIIDDAKRYAQYDVPLLLTGPAGLPKAALAQCIHNASLHHRSPFVTADLSTIPLETQTEYLFGSDAAPTKPGLISVAHTGTLFLLDVQLLTPESQHQLLNVLRNKTYFRRGNSTAQPVVVRVICSTFKNLSEMAAAGTFLEPLANTLSTMTLDLLPLSHLREDLPWLINHHLDITCAKYKKTLTLTDEALELMAQYDWPGNFRELETFCERMVILSPTPRVGADFIRQRLYARTPARENEAPVMVVVDREESALRSALRQAGHNRALAAELLGISRSTLWRRMRKYGIE